MRTWRRKDLAIESSRAYISPPRAWGLGKGAARPLPQSPDRPLLGGAGGTSGLEEPTDGVQGLPSRCACARAPFSGSEGRCLECERDRSETPGRPQRSESPEKPERSERSGGLLGA